MILHLCLRCSLTPQSEKGNIKVDGYSLITADHQSNSKQGVSKFVLKISTW